MGKELSREEFKSEVVRLYLDFANICKDLNLTHWLAFGTLLGAVRHNGFIPWDDDFDVFIPRKDYEKLLNYFEKNNNLIGNYSLLDPHLSRNYPYCFPRFNDNRFIQYEPGRKHNYGLGLNFDIYPLDGAHENDTKQIKRLLFCKRLLDLRTNFKKPRSINPIKNFFKSIARFVIKIVPPKCIILKMHKIAKKYDFDTAEQCGDIVWDPHLKLMEKRWFDKTIILKFENVECPAPVGYDDFLKSTYGDYMKLPPIEKRVGYHISSIVKK